MKIIIFYSFLLCAGMAPAGSQEPDQAFQLKVENRDIDFIRDPEKHLVLSQNCRKENGSLGCEAFSAFTKLSSKEPVHTHKRGGVNPGAMSCSSLAGGKVVIGVDDKGNEQSFCAFSDGSYISNSSIAYAAKRLSK